MTQQTAEEREHFALVMGYLAGIKGVPLPALEQCMTLQNHILRVMPDAERQEAGLRAARARIARYMARTTWNDFLSLD